MVIRALTIYSAATNPQRTDITVDTGSGAFSGAGTYNNVYRADLYDSQGNLAAIVPCDSANSSIDVVSTFFNKHVEFHLKFLYVLGTPGDTSGFFADISFQGNSLVFVAGKIDHTQFVQPPTSVPCEQFFAWLAQTGGAPAEISSALTTATLEGIFPAPWKKFTFGGNLFYRLRKVLLPSGAVHVFTFEREIPALDSFGIRLLPPPFSIPIALRENGGDPKTIALRCVQRPTDDWFGNTAGSPANWYIDTIGFQTNAIAHFWQNAVVNRYIGAMRAVSGAEALSLLPSFGSIADSDWRLRLPVPTSQGPLSLELLGALDEPPSTTAVGLTFDAFQRHSGGAFQVNAVLQNHPPDQTPSASSAPWMGFGLTSVTLNGDSAIRLGSLDLTIAPPPAPPAPPTPPPLWMACNVSFIDSGGGYWVPQVNIGSNADQPLPLSSVQPGGQDDPGDPQYAAAVAAASANNLTPTDPLNRAEAYHRQESLVIPVQPDNSASNLSLSFRESSVAGQNQQLTLTVSASSQSTTPNDVLVIDPNPFSVALARLPNLASAASEETNQVAVWSNSFPEGPGWRITAGAGTFELLLAPQGVGEAMVTAAGAAGEPAEEQTVDFRLTPPAQASLLTSSQAQRYSEPGWNLRRTLGYPGERAPGAAVNSMQFEMLYGLTCNVATTGLQMSEMFSRLGGFAGPLTDVRTGGLRLSVSNASPYTAEQQTWFDTLNGSWAAAYEQLLSRLGVFELWNQERGFDLLLTDGISYDLRFAAANLSGGAIYALNRDPAVTQAEIEQLQHHPHSSSATLIDPRFSALGGWGRQRAGFNNDIVKIESSVSMGYLDSLVVTVIGRIANLWHKAKHVTVYERSVRPSRQFYLEQPSLEGRPILRKTQEYVEILQKTRAYPETGPNVARGFVEGCEFKSIRINVDGNAWGSSIGSGTIIPLWRRDAVPADVYPRPHVTLQLSTDPATGNGSQMAEILNPEKLYFYTDGKQTDPDTNKWPAVQFVDYCNTQPVRSVLTSATPDHLVEPGFGRFTYSVGSDAAQINVVSERTASAMSSALRNVTFMRSQSGLTLPDPANVQMNALVLHDHVANALDQLRKAAAGPLQQGQSILQAVQSRLTGIQNDVVTPFQTACSKVAAASDTGICQTLADAAVKTMASAAAPLSNTWQQLVARLTNDFAQVTGDVQNFKDSIEQALLSQVDAAYASVQSLMGPLVYDLSTAAGLSAELTGIVTAITADLNDLETRVNAAANASDWQNCALVAQRCCDDVNSVLGDVQDVIDAANGLFGTRALSATELQTLSSGLSAFTAAVSTDFSNVLAQIQAEAVSNAISAIESVKSALAGMQLAQQAANLSNKLNIAAGTANQFAASIRTLRDNLRSGIKGVTSGTVADFNTAIQTALHTWGPPSFDTLLKQAEGVVSQQVTTACSGLIGTITGLASQFGDQLNGLLSSNAITNLLPAGTTASVTDFLAAFDRMETNYTAQLDAVMHRCLDLVDTSKLQAASTNALNLMRAFGAPPAVPGLGFNLPGGAADAIAYFYQTAAVAGGELLYQLPQNVPITAALTSVVTQASDAVNGALQQLGVGLPTNALLDRLLPDADALSQLNLSDLIPNIAGLDLTNLFPNVDVPDVAGDNIKISHHIDPQNLRASLDVTLNFPIDDYDEVTVFSIGPVTVTAKNCVFQAQVHVAGGAGQSPQHTSSGSITADWNCYIAGTQLITFMNTGLTFDEAGHLSFHIEPSQVKLAAVMQFLTELLSELEPDGGLTLNPLPGGIQSLLDLDLPDISAGAFGITNLSLGCLFELDFSPFAIKVGANLGQQSAPFTLTVFILGGAGWFEAAVTYAPGSGGFSADISIGIMASAGLSIALGPISGGVFIYFGITAEFHIGGGTNCGLTIGLEIMIQGRVSLLGIVDADITLLLEAEYQSGGGLIGRGEVDVSIKICWCFTLEIHKSVEMTFGSAGARSQVAAATSGGHLLAEALVAPLPLALDPDPLQSYAISVSNRINFLS